MKAAAEFGLTKTMKPAALLVFITDVHAMGLEIAQGLVLTTAWYSDLNDRTRAFSKRFFDKVKKEPAFPQAAFYSATLTYLDAVKAAGTTDSDKVMDELHKMKINDAFVQNATIRADGLLEHDMYIMEVKKPSESKGEWDYYKLLKTMSGAEAFGKLADFGLPAGEEVAAFWRDALAPVHRRAGSLQCDGPPVGDPSSRDICRHARLTRAVVCSEADDSRWPRGGRGPGARREAFPAHRQGCDADHPADARPARVVRIRRVSWHPFGEQNLQRCRKRSRTNTACSKVAKLVLAGAPLGPGAGESGITQACWLRRRDLATPPGLCSRLPHAADPRCSICAKPPSFPARCSRPIAIASVAAAGRLAL